MARTVKPEEFAAKRGEILGAARRLVLTKGYEQMSIQDILDDVGISSGAFHHYFASRGALLNAFVERIEQEVEKPLLPIIHDPHLNAIEKLQGFFDILDRLRVANKTEVINLGRIWYSDDNAIVRLKVEEAVSAQRAPLLTEIVHQGVREGIFTIPDPGRAGEIILSLLQGMGNAHARLLLTFGQEGDDERRVEEIIAIHAAYMDAIERVLGAPPNSFWRATAEAASIWIEATRE